MRSGYAERSVSSYSAGVSGVAWTMDIDNLRISST